MGWGFGMITVILGTGPAAREATRHLPDAIAVPQAWHAEAGRLWIEDGAGVRAVAFDRLLLVDAAPLLLVALGCAYRDGAPVVDGRGETTCPGVFAAGPALGMAGAAGVAQVRLAAVALAGRPAGGRIEAAVRPLPAVERLDPVAVAGLLEQEPGPARDAALLAQCSLVGPVALALPVGLAALAAMAGEMPEPRPVQSAAGELG